MQATSPAIDKGDPDPQYNDPEDPDKPGFALYPAQDNPWNDMDAYGGPFASYWDPAIFASIPFVLALVSPFNCATGVPTTLLFGWNFPWGATSYELQVSNSADFSTLIVDTANLKGSSFCIRNMAENTHYYWRVNATHAAGTGFYSTTLSFTTKGPTAIEQPGLSTPVAYGLFQNYPNPFSDKAEIHFALPESSKILIDVYDIIGKKMETLVHERLPPGYYKTEFEGKNYQHKVYLCRIQAGN